jgi:hypothetical protein
MLSLSIARCARGGGALIPLEFKLTHPAAIALQTVHHTKKETHAVISLVESASCRVVKPPVIA